ncbi:SMP-30/gluconolactonase/LRE family protein [Gordonia humi]|uniref:Sugar lactone lactonase YvrE n=1 Tax=Gordonia humi TaxID=686429 RepID=A0A840F0C4_9ACTN|nr:sugar lactone lactonase YvrE [Gordonia humi]
MSTLRLIPVPGSAPEDVVVLPDGRIATGLADGRLVAIDVGSGEAEVLADTAGHLLGLDARADGSIVICDHDRGLLLLEAGRRRATVLADTVDGRPLHFASNAATASDGSVYFTTSSQRFTIDRWRADLIEHSGTGRLCRRLPDGGVEVLLGGLQFANGVVLAPDETYALVAETGGARITRYWLTGERAGSSEVFVYDLPGYPDNMAVGSDGLVWVALASPRNSVLESMFKLPLRARKILARAPERIGPAPEETVRVLGIGFDGTIVHDVRRDHPEFSFVTGVAERDGVLYLGTILHDAIGVLPVD